MQATQPSESMKRAIVLLCGSAIARLSFIATSIMSNLTKPQPPRLWETPNYQSYPVHRHQGIDYRLVPECVFAKLAGQKDSLFWLTVGMSCVAIAAITAYAIDSTKPPAANASAPMIIEKPVIVKEKEVVPTNCLVWCK